MRPFVAPGTPPTLSASAKGVVLGAGGSTCWRTEAGRHRAASAPTTSPRSRVRAFCATELQSGQSRSVQSQSAMRRQRSWSRCCSASTEKRGAGRGGGGGRCATVQAMRSSSSTQERIANQTPRQSASATAGPALGRIDNIKANPGQLTEAQYVALVRLRVARRWLALRAKYAGRTVRGTSTRHIDPDRPGKGDVD